MKFTDLCLQNINITIIALDCIMTLQNINNIYYSNFWKETASINLNCVYYSSNRTHEYLRTQPETPRKHGTQQHKTPLTDQTPLTNQTLLTNTKPISLRCAEQKLTMQQRFLYMNTLLIQ